MPNRGFRAHSLQGQRSGPQAGSRDWAATPDAVPIQSPGCAGQLKPFELQVTILSNLFCGPATTFHPMIAPFASVETEKSAIASQEDFAAWKPPAETDQSSNREVTLDCDRADWPMWP
jgi:hypothetical protein